jgi:hypothetical protein
MKWRWRIIGRPDAPTEPGGGARVDQGAPDHVAGNGEAAPAQMEASVGTLSSLNPRKAGARSLPSLVHS